MKDKDFSIEMYHDGKKLCDLQSVTISRYKGHTTHVLMGNPVSPPPETPILVGSIFYLDQEDMDIIPNRVDEIRITTPDSDEDRYTMSILDIEFPGEIRTTFFSNRMTSWAKKI